MSQRTTLIAAAGIVAATALVLHLMGRVPICECGEIRLWYGDAGGPGNSQHLSDWYTFSHVIHGFIFYGALWFLRGRLSLGTRLLLAIGIESAWEIVENTDFIIDRYREQTVSLDYHGDSILNSVSDILFMVAGFFLARRLPVAATVAIAVALEIWVGFMIRDNLTLNVLMLLWPLEAVREWQAGG
ncbi:DUF2585 domain-containing protein [Lutibaculum baratangense]|uniref:UPF0314 protein N177_1465 n=1 Tax=Lutibaculum baratangense AMV1 TaxID=631454 RepID=V4R0V1_9HYPH|nr:DUF2585 domain-containing protein [Lutibaculum baratangense]ESR25632.1 Intracellular septation protein [Lutibaculum baratangense AMV1]